MPQFRGKWIVEKRINREIFGYIVQICCIAVFIVVSYFLFTNSRISQYAGIAAAYDTTNVDLMMSYTQDSDAVLNTEDTLDKGIIAIKNPNKRNVNSTIYLYISENAKLDTIDFIIDGNVIDTTNAEIKDGYYIVSISNFEIDAFDEKYMEAEIKGNPYYTIPFSYLFNIESI